MTSRNRPLAFLESPGPHARQDAHGLAHDQKEKIPLTPLGLVLLLLGIRYDLRRQQLTALVADDFPNVAPDQFRQWQSLELRSIDVFLRVAAVLFVIGTMGSILLSMASPADSAAGIGLIITSMVLIGAHILVFFIGLTVSAVHGSKAARLRKSLGIVWPKRG
jgi:hypothetical protein